MCKKRQYRVTQCPKQTRCDKTPAMRNLSAHSICDTTTKRDQIIQVSQPIRRIGEQSLSANILHSGRTWLQPAERGGATHVAPPHTHTDWLSGHSWTYMIGNVFGVVFTIMHRQHSISQHPAMAREINYEIFIRGGRCTQTLSCT